MVLNISFVSNLLINEKENKMTQEIDKFVIAHIPHVYVFVLMLKIEILNAKHSHT